MDGLNKFVGSKGTQSIITGIILLMFSTTLLHYEVIGQVAFISLFGMIIFISCVIFFREQVSRLLINVKSGEFALELQRFEEDIVNALILKQKLLEISSGRWDGPPEKLRQILDILGEQGESKLKKYSKASVYAENIINAYKNIDSIGVLKTADPDLEIKKQKMDNFQKDLSEALNDFLSYLNKR